MSTMKKTAAAENNHGRKFPAEAYEWNDDVTKESVEKVREDARRFIDKGDWEVIDGFGRNSAR